MLHHVSLAKSDLQVSRLGLGCMGMSEFYGPSDDEESARTLQHAVERGVTFFDTAETYGLGHNEKLLAPLIRAHPGKLTVATKWGIYRKPGEYGRVIDNSEQQLQESCEGSLQRLGVERIDLYYLHRRNPEVPIEDTVGAMARLVEAGKVKALGLCEVSAETLRKAHAVHPITALQSEWSLWTRDLETDGALAACRELGIAIVPYSPLGRGFLTAGLRSTETLAADDFRRLSPRFQDEALARNLKLLDALEDIAKARQVTPAQVALAWLLAQGEDVIPIPGTRRASRIDENIAAAELELFAAELQKLDQAMPPGSAIGNRYPDAGMKGVNT